MSWPSSVDAKIARSQEHLNALNAAIGQYIRDKFSPLRMEFTPTHDGNAETDLVEASDIPRRIPAIVGDIVQNLRSALDHLVWELVLANGSTPTDQTDFALLLSRPSDKNGNPAPLKLEGQIPPGALAEIERLQPANAGHPSLAAMTNLGKLRELSNVDKHRHLTLMQMSWGQGSYLRKDMTDWSKPTVIDWIFVSRTEDGAVLKPADPAMDMYGRFVVQITIGQSRPIGNDPPAFPKTDEPLASTLRAIRDDVVEAIASVRASA